MVRVTMFTRLLSRLRGTDSDGPSNLPGEIPGFPPEFVCKHCGAASYSPRDREERYCGWCHHFCDDYDAGIRPRTRHICPRCGVQLTKVIRQIGQSTRYFPCGHKDFLADLEVHDEE